MKTTIPFSFIHLSKQFPDSKIILPNELKDNVILSDLEFDFLFLTTEQTYLLEDNLFDIAVNTNSFMEMLPETINGYFKVLRRVLKEENVFYCHNRAEKTMRRPDAKKNSLNILYNNPNVIEQSIPVRFSDYPWDIKDKDYFYYIPRLTEVKFKHSFFVRATKLAKTTN